MFAFEEGRGARVCSFENGCENRTRVGPVSLKEKAKKAVSSVLGLEMGDGR